MVLLLLACAARVQLPRLVSEASFFDAATMAARGTFVSAAS
jgi:hypothetical protein